uniref:Uncharacterized protein n=1 Tax=Anguilla anguilla TaxID=7936 RepID=A0A0E9X1B8_ANGAN
MYSTRRSPVCLVKFISWFVLGTSHWTLGPHFILEKSLHFFSRNFSLSSPY